MKRQPSFLRTLLIALILLSWHAQAGQELSAVSNFKITDFIWYSGYDTKLSLTSSPYGNGSIFIIPGDDLHSKSANSQENGFFSIGISPYFLSQYIGELIQSTFTVNLNLGFQYTTDRMSRNLSYSSNSMTINDSFSDPYILFNGSGQIGFSRILYWGNRHLGLNLNLFSSFSPSRNKSITTNYSETLVPSSSPSDMNITMSKSVSEYYYKNNLVTFSPLLTFGLGRIHDGTGAYNAIQMAEDLNDEKLLSRPISPEDMQILAILISTNYRDIWDSRKNAIERITQISTFLQSKGYLSNCSPKSTMILMDTWSHMPQNSSRLFGSTLELRLGGLYNFNEHSYINPNGEGISTSLHVSNGSILSSNSWTNSYSSREFVQEHNIQVFLGGSYSSCNPISKKWQFNQSYRLDAYLLDLVNTHESRSNNSPTWCEDKTGWITRYFHLQPAVSLSLKYLPSTRLNFTGHFSGTGDFYRVNDPSSLAWTYIGIKGVLNFSAAYSVRPDIQLNLNMSVTYLLGQSFGNQYQGTVFPDEGYHTAQGLSEFADENGLSANLNLNFNVSATWRIF